VKGPDKNLINLLLDLRRGAAATVVKQNYRFRGNTEHIFQELNALGFIIEQNSNGTVRMIKDSDLLFAENILSYRRSHYRTKPVFVFSKTKSTMDAAARHFKGKYFAAEQLHGAIWVADSQSQGRGRFSRTWHSPHGLGCWFTTAVYREAFQNSNVLSYAASLAVHEALKGLFNIDTALKWPNDILFEDKKVCGILVEKSPAKDCFLVGVGINVFQSSSDFPQDIRDNAISLAQILGRDSTKLSRCKIIATVSDLIMEKASQCWSKIRTDWISRCPMFNKFVIVHEINSVYKGIFYDVDPTGALILLSDSGKLTKHYSAEVTITGNA